jgi:uncharacterized protein YndB with AHSA1/START domain
MTRQGVTQHLAVLEAAGLVTTVRVGREKLHYLNPVPLHELHERWISKFERPELDALAHLKHHLEGNPMNQDTMNTPAPNTHDKPALVHVAYIAASPDAVWAALTDPELTAQYWAHRNVSTWNVGDRWEHQRLGGGTDVVGTILECDPPRRLVQTWVGAGSEGDPAKTSRVTFDLEPLDEAVRLTVTHDQLPNNEVEGTNAGWAKVLASLKTLLEVGRPLDVMRL